jgi:KDO2-lipid IV(A) lauroyltransferase
MPISKLPFKAIYIFADLSFLLIYYIINFRKKLVYQNIYNSFPNLSEADHKKIKKNFYKNIVDIFMESLKFFSIKEKQILKRVTYTNLDILEQIYDDGRNVIVMLSHFNNWEAFITSPRFIRHKVKSLYKPLRNQYLNNKILKSRKQFGMYLITPKFIKSNLNSNSKDLSAYCFFSDQSPANTKNCYWTTFLNQETCFLMGAEIYAKAYNYPVVYAGINKKSRGYYEMFLELIDDNPSQTADGFITEEYARRLERDILKNPESWLWGHRRWKHKKIKA